MKAQKVYTASLCLLTFYILSIFLVPLIPMVNKENIAINNEETDDMKVLQDTEFQSPSKTIPSYAANYNPAGIYPWWDPNFSYRVPLQINSTYINRINYTVRIPMNFTKYLSAVNWSGTFDELSVRVIEYNSTFGIVPVNTALTGSNQSVVPSLFIKSKNASYNALTNAFGQLVFQINGNASANTNRTFMVYFDIIENGKSHSLPDILKWKFDYNYETDVVGLGKQNLAYGSTYATPNYGSLTVWNDQLTDTLFDNVVGGVMNYYFDTIAGDFDGDGNVELLTSDRANYFHVMDINPSTRVWSDWKQPNLAEDFNFETLLDNQIPVGYNWNLEQIAAADIDNDGCTEIISVHYDTNDYILIFNLTKSGNTYTLNLENYIQGATSGYNFREFAIADLNMDGFLDIVTGTYTTATYYIRAYINKKLGYTTYNNAFTLQHSYAFSSNPLNVIALRCGDIDFDGKVEIIQTDNDQLTIRVLEYDTIINQIVQEGVYPTNVQNAIIGDMVDIDNDGRIEIVIGNWFTTANVRSSMAVYEVRGDRDLPMNAEGLNVSIPYHRLAYPQVGDIDNDGTVEIIAGSYRRFDSSYYPRVNAFSLVDPNIVYKWASPEKYQAVGETWGSQLAIFGSWNNKVLRREPAFFIYDGEVKKADLEIQVLDMDKAPVENAKVQIKNSSWTGLSATNSIGQTRFLYLDNGDYDIQINMTSDEGNYEQTAIAEIGIKINNSKELITYRTYNTSIWQMAFDMKDTSGIPVNLGHILLYNSSYEDAVIIANISTANGWKTGEKFVWFNRIDVDNLYNLTAYYNNPSYNPQITELNKTTALQQTDNIQSGWFNATPSYFLAGSYVHSWYYYANGSSLGAFGNQRLNWVNISISNINSDLDKVVIYLIKETFNDPIKTYELSGTVTNWNVELPLWNYGSKGYGIIITTYTTNATLNSGIINVTLEEEYTKTIYVPLAKYYMNFIDSQNNTAIGLIVRVYNDSIAYNQKIPLVNLTTTESGDAFGSAGNPFWYLVKPGTDNYTITIHLAAGMQPSFNNVSEWGILPLSDHYNFSLKQQTNAYFQANLDMSKIYTKIYILETPPSSVSFLSTFRVRANITAQSTDDTFPYNSSISAQVTLRVYNTLTDQIVLTKSGSSLVNPSLGIYYYDINPQSDGIALPFNNYNYYIEFSAVTPGYGSNPTPERRSFVINPIQSSLTLREGVTTTQLASLDLYWNQKVSVSAYYFNTQQSAAISAATVTYKAPWNTNAITLQEAPGNPGYYQFDLNTTDAGNVGQYTLEFSAQQTNYTAQSNIKLYLNVKPLKTMLNGTDPDDILFTTSEIKIFKTKAHNLSLVYWDNITDVGVVDAVTKHYIYQYVSKDGNKTMSGEGDLIEIGNGIYILDFDTEYREEGTYFFEVQIAKPNYVAKVASINLNIDTMPIVYDFGKALEGGYLLFADTQGAQISINLNLKDRENNNVALTGSTVTLQIGTTSYELKDNGDGTYSYTFDTSNIDAFAAPVVLTGKIIISKANYTTIEIPVQITVEMPEIFPGVPTFYFSIIIGAVVLLVGTLTMNKVIQNARIPAFVKLILKTSKLISGKKALEDGKVAPTIEQDMVAQFSKDWAVLDLNLAEILGVGAKSSGTDKAGPGDNPGGL